MNARKGTKRKQLAPHVPAKAGAPVIAQAGLLTATISKTTVTGAKAVVNYVATNPFGTLDLLSDPVKAIVKEVGKGAGKTAAKEVTESAGKTILKDLGIGALVSVADEGYNQFRAGKFQPDRLAAVGVLGVDATAAAGGLAAGAALALGVTAGPPVAVAVAASIAVDIGFQVLDDNYHITDNVAKGFDGIGKAIGHDFGL